MLNKSYAATFLIEALFFSKRDLTVPKTASIIYPNIVIRCKLKYNQVKRKCGKMYIKIHLLLEQILDNYAGNSALKVRHEISTLIKAI